MEDANPVAEANPQTSQTADKEQAENIRRTVETLNTVQYLLTAGSFAGKDAELVAVAKAFVKGFKEHLSNQNKA